MRLADSLRFLNVAPWNYAETACRARVTPYRATFLALIACILLSPATLRSAAAQQANQPGFDPRQTEKYFDDRQS
jgi:hypothetical protein